MRIEIRSRLNAFSRQPGTICLIPFTTWEVQVFPTLLRFNNLYAKENLDLPLIKEEGPVKNFMIEQDLERGRIVISGFVNNRYFCHQLVRQNDQLLLDKEPLSLLLQPFSFEKKSEKLSFGIHKQQDLEGMKKRVNPLELWPFILRLSSMVPRSSLSPVGCYQLLARCQAAMEERNKCTLVPLWQQVFIAAFKDLFAPRLYDALHQNLFPEDPLSREEPSIGLIHAAADLIRPLFFREEDDKLVLLPLLPPECHEGRFVHIQTKNADILHFEWSKKQLKKAIFKARNTRTFSLKLPKEIRSFRLRRSLKDKGQLYNNEQPISCKEYEQIYFDCFIN